jgi:hypothetical protein
MIKRRRIKILKNVQQKQLYSTSYAQLKTF